MPLATAPYRASGLVHWIEADILKHVDVRFVPNSEVHIARETVSYSLLRAAIWTHAGATWRGASATGSGNPYCEYSPQLSLTDRADSVAAGVDSCMCTNQA